MARPDASSSDQSQVGEAGPLTVRCPHSQLCSQRPEARGGWACGELRAATLESRQGDGRKGWRSFWPLLWKSAAHSCDSHSGASFSSKDRNPSSLNDKSKFQHGIEE